MRELDAEAIFVGEWIGRSGFVDRGVRRGDVGLPGEETGRDIDRGHHRGLFWRKGPLALRDCVSAARVAREVELDGFGEESVRGENQQMTCISPGAAEYVTAAADKGTNKGSGNKSSSMQSVAIATVFTYSEQIKTVIVGNGS